MSKELKAFEAALSKQGSATEKTAMVVQIQSVARLAMHLENEIKLIRDHKDVSDKVFLLLKKAYSDAVTLQRLIDDAAAWQHSSSVEL